METLLTGYIDSVSQSFLSHLSMKTDIIISAERDAHDFSGKHITSYYQSVLDDDFMNFFSSYSFDAVLFFLTPPESRETDAHELEKLERVLEACMQRPIKKVIVVSSAYAGKINASTPPADDHMSLKHNSIRLFSIKELCQVYRETYHVPITILRTSSLFGEDESVSYVGNSLKQLVNKDHIMLDGKPEQQVSFLSMTDLGRLIERILLEPDKNVATLYVPGASVLSLRQYADVLGRSREPVTVHFTGKELSIGQPLDSEHVSKEYQWEPTVRLEEEIPSLIESMRQNNQDKKKSVWGRIRKFYQSHTLMLAAVELIIGYLLMEYLLDFSQTTVQFRVIDFRLFFVVLFAGAHGPQIGLMAALLASFSTYSSFSAMGVDWRIIFYDVENWIPFASYFIVAWIIGYIRDRYKMDLADAKEDLEYLSNRYALLNDLYLRSLERKSSYEKQIISYSDSFGKLYQFTKLLEYADPSRYFLEALDAVEDMLDSQSISFYLSRENKTRAYRFICSDKVTAETPEIFKYEDYPELKNLVINGGVWTNTKQFEGYPEYAVRIYKTTDFTVFMTVHTASFDQMSLYFENLIKVTGHFVSTTLEHKMHSYEKLIIDNLADQLDKAAETERRSLFHDERSNASVEETQIHVLKSKGKSEDE